MLCAVYQNHLKCRFCKLDTVYRGYIKNENMHYFEKVCFLKFLAASALTGTVDPIAKKKSPKWCLIKFLQ